MNRKEEKNKRRSPFCRAQARGSFCLPFCRVQARGAGIAALGTVLLLAVGLAGNIRITGYVKASVEESMNLAEEKRAEEERLMAEAAGKTAESEKMEVSLTYMETQLLNLLSEKMEAMDLEGAAHILNDNETLIDQLFFGRLADGRFLYDGTAMTELSDGHGLVFQRAGTVFYGDFKNGKPEGAGTALQALKLDEGVRYDYSTGIWKNGVMEGSGECGYNYYEGIAGDNAVKTIKRGNFVQDLMEGEITYISVNGAGGETSWSMRAEHGVIVLDDRWSADTNEGKKIYRLMADNDDVHAYAVDEAAALEVRWKNMIEWDGENK